MRVEVLRLPRKDSNLRLVVNGHLLCRVELRGNDHGYGGVAYLRSGGPPGGSSGRRSPEYAMSVRTLLL
jgi:hypothetical protein